MFLSFLGRSAVGAVSVSSKLVLSMSMSVSLLFKSVVGVVIVNSGCCHCK